MTNEEMVETLVDCDFEYIMQTANGLELLRDYLDQGFIGYSNFTTSQLIDEINQRKEMGQL